MSVIRSHKATGVVPYPFILLEGEEKAGKSWAMVALSASKKVGDTYIIDLGEGAADEYGAIPGADFQVIDHDGTYAQVIDQVEAVRDEAARAKAAGEPPVVLGIDSMTEVWDGLKDWVSERARGSRKNQEKLRADPAAEIDVSRNLWNDAGNRYRRLMTLLLTFPGIVVVTARGKEVSATDPNTGQPYRDGRRDWSVQSHRSLPFDATAWVRMRRDHEPLLVGIRSVKGGIRPGKDRAQPLNMPADANFLEWLVFEAMGVDPGKAEARAVNNLTGGELSEEERAEDPDAPVVSVVQPQEVAAATTVDELNELAKRAEKAGQLKSPQVRQAFDDAMARIKGEQA